MFHHGNNVLKLRATTGAAAAPCVLITLKVQRSFKYITNLKKFQKCDQIAFWRPRWSYFLLLYTMWHLHWTVSDLLELSWLPETYFD